MDQHFSEVLVHFLSVAHLFHIDSLNLKNDRPGAVVAAGNHDAVVLRPSMHDAAALKCSINIAADGIPCLGAEGHTFCSAVRGARRLKTSFIGCTGFHQRAGTGMPIIIPLIIAIEQEFIPDIETGTFSAVRHSAVLLLQFREKFLVDNGYFASVSIDIPPAASIAEKNPKLASNPLYQDYQSTL